MMTMVSINDNNRRVFNSNNNTVSSPMTIP
jgi:hypothetical protein